MKRRSVTAGLAAIVLGLTVALVPAASASAVSYGSITVYNNCGASRWATIYVGTTWWADAIIQPGDRRIFTLTPGTYRVGTYPTTISVTVRANQGFAVRLCL